MNYLEKKSQNVLGTFCCFFPKGARRYSEVAELAGLPQENAFGSIVKIFGTSVCLTM